MFGDNGFGVFCGEEGLAAGGGIPNMNVDYVDGIFLKNFADLEVVANLVFMADLKTDDGDFFALEFVAPVIKAWVSAASEDWLEF